MGIEDRVAIVTGAESGIGRAIAVKLGRRGAKVVVGYLHDFCEAQKTLRCFRKGIGYHADVSDAAQAHAMVETAINMYGRVDILVNNAGILLPNNDPWFDGDLYQEMYKVNVQGGINCITSVVPHMLKQGYGRIINIASVRGVREGESNREYARTKRVVLHKTREYAELLAPHITVNAVSPGMICAPMVDNKEKTEAELQETSLMRRLGTPEEIAHAVKFLADDNAGYITGQNITLDGGLLQKTKNSR